jgi:glutamate synthase domain-containing protein 2
MHWLAILGGLAAVLLLWVLLDVLQRRHAIIHNFPIVGHFRYWLENIGPELRQYIVTSNNEERPFSRDERRWVYASSKCENNTFGFGTDNDLESSPNYIIIKHAAFPIPDRKPGEPGYDPRFPVPCAKVLGAARGRKKAFRPASVVNVSGMSFGSLSGRAVESLNRGAKLAGCLQNTGEGGVSRHHQHGGELIWQVGTAYFGCRDARGGFDLERFLEVVAANPIRAVEIKLSQGAKPGLGGLLPAAKITPEIAEIRGIPLGKDCASPSSHSAFHDVDGLLDFVERLADRTGLPIGIKSAVGETAFWEQLARRMRETGKGVDFVTIDGGEGGTGAAPLVFSDHVALPFKLAMARVYPKFVAEGLHEQVVFIGSGKLGFPEMALLAFALGCDAINVGREAMLAIGCIQAQRCHTGHCPTGVTTHNRWLVRGLDPSLKSVRVATYAVTLRKEMLQLSRACGALHSGVRRRSVFNISRSGVFPRPKTADRSKRSSAAAPRPPHEPAGFH